MNVNDPELIAGFFEEVRSVIPEIRDSLLAARTSDLANYGLEPGDVLEPAFRHSHNIKGTATLVQMPLLSALAEELQSSIRVMSETRTLPNDESLSLFEATLGALEDLLLRLEQDRPADLDTIAEIQQTHQSWREQLAHAPQSDPPSASPEEYPTEIEEVSEELVQVFTEEAEDHLKTIQTRLAVLKRKPDDKPTLLEIRRSVHTLKGSAAMVGFHGVAKLAHRMEDLLDLLSEGEATANAEIIDLLQSSGDALEDLTPRGSTPALARGKITTPPVELLRRYDQLMPTLQGQASPEQSEQSLSSATPELVEIYRQTNSTADALAEPASEAKETANESREQDSKSVLRVPLERLDGIVKLVSELVINRTAFEQRMGQFVHLMDELKLSANRLRRAATKLETEYEVRALARASGSIFTDTGFDELEFDRYTEFHLLTRELGETTIDLHTVAQEFAGLHGDFEGYLNRQARLSSEIQDKLMRVRMVPFSTLATRLHRTVRTTARQLAKQVDMVIEGENTELDKSVLEEMVDPLLHLLRNAVDHGIEAPSLRERNGKPTTGTIRIRTYAEGTQVVIKISDDGNGIDPVAVRNKAVAQGLFEATEANRLSEPELHSLLFMPGFSTAAALSEISGRGVGLDVVKAQVNKLKGTIDVSSESKRGTIFTIRLPLTLAIIRALLAQSANQTFAIPLPNVKQILRPDPAALEQIGKETVVRIGTKLYPRVSLAKRLNLKQTQVSGEAKPQAEDVADRPTVLMQAGDSEIALVVDELLGGREIVLKNLGSHIRKAHGIAGATVLGDGSVVLVLNPADLSREPGSSRTMNQADLARTGIGLRPTSQTGQILIVDDSPSVRRVVSQMLQKAGYRTLQAKDGLDALEVLHHTGQAPDVILLDIEMPRMDGYELLSTLRAQAATASIPVVMVTSRAGDRHRRKAMDAGATAYLVKPYPEESLFRLLRELRGETR
jgi:chemosensory pili system protein ChpA (sensor histidine kinase/response regulator)